MAISPCPANTSRSPIALFFISIASSPPPVSELLF